MNTSGGLARDSFFAAILYVAPRIANVLLFILIGRSSGPGEAGIFALATTFLLIFSTLTRGLDDLIIREVSRQPEKSPGYFSYYALLRLVSVGLLYLVLYLLVVFILGYTPHTRSTILILTISLIPDALTYVAQAVLIGNKSFARPAASMLGAALFKIIAGGWAIIGGYHLEAVAVWWLVGSLVGMISSLAFVIQALRPYPWKSWIQWESSKALWVASIPFFLITILNAFETQTDTVMLSIFHGEVQVGWYNAATTLAYSLALIAQSYRLSVYPRMAQYALTTPARLSHLYEQSFRYLGLLVLPMAAGLALLARPIVMAIYGAAFEPTILTLQLLTPVLVFMFLNVPSVRVMFVNDRQGWSLIFLSISVLINFVLNLILTPLWGTTGAALARLFSAASFFSLTYIYVNANIVKIRILKILLKPALATFIMALLIFIAGDFPWYGLIALGLFSYPIILWLVREITPADAAMLRNMLHEGFKGSAGKSTPK